MIGMRSGISRLVCGFVIFVVLLLGGVSTSWCAEADYYGVYAGTFNGDDNGVWIGVVSSDPLAHLFMSYSPLNDFGDGGNIFFNGEVGTVGNFSGTSGNGSAIDVAVDSSVGTVSGTWSNSPDSGALTGAIVTSSSYAGSYSGTISGDATGIFSATIASDGTIAGSVTAGGDTFDILGGCHPDGWVMAYGIDSYGYMVGMIGQFSGSSISGDWGSESDDEGTFTTVSSSSSDGGGGGGGGGCFILSLTSE
jgi:hypothetical protein